MGSSTGNMLVDNKKVLSHIFNIALLIATHCEDELTIRKNLANLQKYGDIPFKFHPVIRSEKPVFILLTGSRIS